MLGKSRHAVVKMVRRGELSDAGCDRWRRVDPEELARLVAGRRGPLEALAAILSGRLVVPKDQVDALALSLSDRLALLTRSLDPSAT